jgi:hypothetical protein
MVFLFIPTSSLTVLGATVFFVLHEHVDDRRERSASPVRRLLDSRRP